MGKVFEKRFAIIGDAVSYLENAHWNYAGRKGLIRKYDEYRGSMIFRRHENPNSQLYEDKLVAKLAQDGYLSIHADKSTLTSISLPDYVWPSLDNYNRMLRFVAAVNEKLNEIQSGIKVGFSHRPLEYPVFLVKETEVLENLTSPLHALRSEHAESTLSEHEVERFHMRWFQANLSD